MRCKSSREICATCDYWTGKRNPVFDAANNEKVDILDRQGDCMNTASRFLDQIRNYDKKCIHYSKWTELI